MIAIRHSDHHRFARDGRYRIPDQREVFFIIIDAIKLSLLSTLSANNYCSCELLFVNQTFDGSLIIYMIQNCVRNMLMVSTSSQMSNIRSSKTELADLIIF